jgi:hypothetical protein
MCKYSCLLIAILMFSTAAQDQQQFDKYKKIEAYEVRPGIEMFPRYTADGQVCEIGLEKLMYTPELVRLDADLDTKEIDEVLDDLVPANERGKPTDKIPGSHLSVETGPAFQTLEDFENVKVQIYSRVYKPKHKNEIALQPVVAVVQWKNRVCK